MTSFQKKPVRDHAKFKNKCKCNFIMWFMFYLRRKNKQLGIAVAMYTYIQIGYENVVHISSSLEHFLSLEGVGRHRHE
jgi:hypothetical protein